jgi:photosystem II stability/assembly factor-like uncharacterized protein
LKLFCATLFVLIGPIIANGQWRAQTFHSDANLRGLSVVNAKVAWISGTKGTYGRTTDGGKTWAAGTVPGAEKLDFRDIEAFGGSSAYLLSSGAGDKSRIYHTADAGRTWTLQFKNSEPDAFYDAIAFWDQSHGLAFGDPVRSRFQLLATDDGGANSKHFAADSLPAALPKEGAFAASGTCLVTSGDRDAWFCTGGARSARVFRSNDRGRHWTVSETPIVAGSESAGAFSIAFRDRDHGLIVGGDYRKPREPGANSAFTADGGRTWKLCGSTLSYRSCVAWAGNRWIAVGTSRGFHGDGQRLGRRAGRLGCRICEVTPVTCDGSYCREIPGLAHNGGLFRGRYDGHGSRRLR